MTLNDDNENITGNGTYTVFWIYGGPILIEDLGKHLCSRLWTISCQFK